MKILFLHGVGSQPSGLKPTYLSEHGYDVSNPQLPGDDYLESSATPLVLLCPSWKYKRMANKVKPNTVILHSRQDEVIPFRD
ncbi:MAG: hypothetical protein ACI814_004190 [Mariniblastus sp.]|jgi:hypothetical protein